MLLILLFFIKANAAAVSSRCVTRLLPDEELPVPGPDLRGSQRSPLLYQVLLETDLHMANFDSGNPTRSVVADGSSCMADAFHAIFSMATKEAQRDSIWIHVVCQQERGG